MKTATTYTCENCRYGYKLSQDKAKCFRWMSDGSTEVAAKNTDVNRVMKCAEFMHIKSSKFNISGDEICVKCLPGYVPKSDGTKCFKSPHPACLLGDNTDNDFKCTVCAGPFYLYSNMCYERIPNCLMHSSTEANKCKVCTPGYGLYPDSG